MRKILVLALITSLFFCIVAMVYADEVAVIVNKENMVNAITFNELVKIFKQEKQYWNGKKIYLIMQETNTDEKKVILRKVFKMTDEDLKKFWLGKIFRGEIADFPKTLASNEAVKRFVSKVPNAVGFIDSAFLDGTVKALKIEGKQPKDKGYILSGIEKNED